MVKFTGMKGGKAGGARTIYFIFAFIVSWLLFATLNGFKNANGECCKTNTCGSRTIDMMWWVTSMVIGIITTIVLGLPLIKVIIRTLLRLMGRG